MKRRDFIKTTLGGAVALVVGSKLPGFMDNPAYAAVRSLNFTITDCIKEMVTYNALSAGFPVAQPQGVLDGTCYFWCFKEATLAANCPGPTIYAYVGDFVDISITNALDEPHALVVENMFNSGAIAPGATVTRRFKVVRAGTFMYYDNLNAPVNRVMGLHGCFIAMPAVASGASYTPYDTATPEVQRLFDDLGNNSPNAATHYPGLRWEEGNASTQTPPYRQYVWLCHQASPKLFAEVGALPPGQIYDKTKFRNLFLRAPFAANARNSYCPQYFTINGESGHFCHNNPVVVPMARVGEPVVVRIMNAGLWSHSMHLHANHYYVLSVNGVVQGVADPLNPTILSPGPIWVDTFTLNEFGQPGYKYDMLVPFMRPPDIPNTRGIGRAGSGDTALLTNAGQPAYPPFEEFNVFMPEKGTTAKSPLDGVTPVSIAVRQSPLCYPMHDHSEASQTSQGGNYNCGLIAGVYFIGDQNITMPRFNVNDDPLMPLLPPQTFPMDEDFYMMITGVDGNTVYGCDQARRTGEMECCRDAALSTTTQADRPLWPPPFPPA
jgi:hypothetical protein